MSTKHAQVRYENAVIKVARRITAAHDPELSTVLDELGEQLWDLLRRYERGFRIWGDLESVVAPRLGIKSPADLAVAVAAGIVRPERLPRHGRRLARRLAATHREWMRLMWLHIERGHAELGIPCPHAGATYGSATVPA